MKCTELEAERTKVQVTYKYIALSEAGEMFVSEFSESAYAEYIGEWQTLLSNYFMLIKTEKNNEN